MRDGSAVATISLSHRCGGYRPGPKRIGSTAIFECKQSLFDFRRDNCHGNPRGTSRTSRVIVARFSKHICAPIFQSCTLVIRSFRSLIPTSSPRSTIAVTRGCSRAEGAAKSTLRLHQVRDLGSVSLREFVFSRVAARLFRESEVPVGWGALVELNDALMLVRKPIWHESTAANRLYVLHRIAMAGTRNLNRELSLDWHEQIVPGHFFGLRQAEEK